MQGARRKQVLVFAGGGLNPASGGVGTLMRYLVQVWADDPVSLPVRVIDSRGPGGAVSALLHFGHALAVLAWAAVMGRVACAHIHMTTRGSAWRKAALCTLARLVGVPTLLHLHGADFFEFCARLPAPLRHLLRAGVAGADRVAVIGTQWRTRLIQELGIEPHRIRVVLNGVPAAPPRPEPTGPVGILFLGRLGVRKGIPELVAALASPEMMARPWSATIAGDGDTALLDACIAGTASRDHAGTASRDHAGTASRDHAGTAVQARIRTPGWLGPAAAAAALDEAHILVLPSHHEVMPIAILEAMARGLAIVATPVGAIPEILRDGINACLIPPGDAAALALALAGLVDDPARRRRLGGQARRDFAERLDVAVPAAALQAIYRELAMAEPHAVRIRTASA